LAKNLRGGEQVHPRLSGGNYTSLEHVGSTSIPSLWAKPIIDIISGVEGRADVESCRMLLLSLGYDDTSSGDNPDWYYCLAKTAHIPGFHLHLVREGSPHHLKHILFRDWLRTHPSDTEAYKKLKLSLSQKHRTIGSPILTLKPSS
jgi:GrpB-like predicted nucleotidyltransferase (UPF0157 family)